MSVLLLISLYPSFKQRIEHFQKDDLGGVIEKRQSEIVVGEVYLLGEVVIFQHGSFFPSLSPSPPPSPTC